jgi:hypothetical protein
MWSRSKSIPLLVALSRGDDATPTIAARLDLVYQDGCRLRLAHRGGVFLYPIPKSQWTPGHRPAFLVARDDRGRLLGKQLLYEYTLAPG